MGQVTDGVIRSPGGYRVAYGQNSEAPAPIGAGASWSLGSGFKALVASYVVSRKHKLFDQGGGLGGPVALSRS
jgi:hypothetical protein